MKNVMVAVVLIFLMVGCTETSEPIVSGSADLASVAVSGIDLVGMDTSVRPQDDFYEYANGNWLKTTEIPAEEIGWGSYMTLRKESLEQSRAIVEELADIASPNEQQAQIGDYFAAWMNEAQIQTRQLTPLASELAAISALKTHDDVARAMGELNAMGVDSPFNFYVGQDDKDSTRYVVFFIQSGLGMPDRDYYFDESERGQLLLGEYQKYVATLFSLAKLPNPDSKAEALLALETALAKPQWDKVKNRDAELTYNLRSDADFRALLQSFDLDSYLPGIGVAAQPFYIVSQPTYLQAFNTLFTQTPVALWQDYLRLRLLSSYANFLPDEFVQARFDFYARTIAGREEMTPRWRRAISSINQNLGELLGQLYVERHFSPESKSRMLEMVKNLNAAYADSIRGLDWMSDETKEKALLKLSKFTPKIGYPDKWRDYSDLTVDANDLVGNIKRARTFNHNLNVAKLGQPIDRDEWFMAPQEVNAYYNPGLNEIVFRAAYLQAPNFIPEADDAYNYGTIGVTIGHEIGHGFDDQGSKYDGDGNLVSWWTEADRANFEQRTAGLVEQFNRFEPLPGLFINGELTLGENIGDLGGTAIALKAYRLSLNGKDAPVIDGFTAEERFFLGNAQSSRLKWRDQFMEMLVKTDPHSPDRFRINGVMPNLAAFYQTYDVQEGDKLYLPEEKRVSVW